jgi:hypothetical protein
VINTSKFKFTNDKLIRTAFRKRLENTYKDDKDVRIIDELGVIHGSARVDMAVVNGIIHGFELKSDLDTLRRLPEQMDAYNSVFDQVTLVVGKNHVHEAIRAVPEWWGVIIAKISDSNDEINFVPIREAVDNPERNPVSVARLLWRQEALDVLEKNGHADGVRSKPRNIIYHRLATVLNQNDLGAEVRQCLFTRADWRVEKQHMLCGD